MKVDLDRKAKIEKDIVIVNSAVKEELTPAEFANMYYQKSQDLGKVQGIIEQGKNQLKEIGDVEETEELKAMKEKLILAEKLKRRGEITSQIRELEKQEETLKKEMEIFNPIMQKLAKKE